MPIALVQSRSIAGANLAFAGGVTKGNLIVVVAGSLDLAGAVTFACSDTQGNVYNSTALVDDNPAGGRAQLFYCLAKQAGLCIITITTTSATPQLAIHEFSGVSTFNTSAAATGLGNSQDSGPITTTDDNELLFGFSLCVVVGGTSANAGAGWTQAELLGFNLLTEYQIVGIIGTYDATTQIVTNKAGTNNWITEIATFIATTVRDYYIGARQRMSRITPGIGNFH